MTEAETAVREALVKMTPGDYSVRQYGDCLEIRAADMTLIAEIGLFCFTDTQNAIRDDLAGIVALRNHTPALLAELDAARAQLARLREALGDLLSWFPDKKPEPEWRLKAGERGADDAIEAARAALEARP